jgi:hypothetical protein
MYSERGTPPPEIIGPQVCVSEKMPELFIFSVQVLSGDKISPHATPALTNGAFPCQPASTVHLESPDVEALTTKGA